MPINVFEPKSQFISQKSEITNAIKKVLNSGSYILGKEVIKLEKNFAKLHNSKFAIAVKNGTDALTISLKILNIGKGDEVITTSHTAQATIAAIVDSGATPVIVDIEKNYYTLDPNLIEDKITKKTKAVIPVHIYGQCCEMKKITKIAKKWNIYLIEDCSQAHGAKIYNKSVGTFGIMSTFSFYPTKNLGAIGDGGIIVTRKKSIAEKIKKFREYGWNKNRSSKNPGINSRLDEMQAAILNTKLKIFKKTKNVRIKIAKEYLKKIKNKNITLPEIRKNSTHVFHIFSILIKNRKNFLRYLNYHKVYPGIHYPRLAHMNKGYSKLCKFNNLSLKNSAYLTKSTVSLPIYPELSLKNLNKIIKLVNNYK